MRIDPHPSSWCSSWHPRASTVATSRCTTDPTRHPCCEDAPRRAAPRPVTPPRVAPRARLRPADRAPSLHVKSEGAHHFRPCRRPGLRSHESRRLASSVPAVPPPITGDSYRPDGRAAQSVGGRWAVASPRGACTRQGRRRRLGVSGGVHASRRRAGAMHGAHGACGQTSPRAPPCRLQRRS